MVCSPLGSACSTVVPAGSQVLPANLLHGYTGPSRSLLPWDHSFLWASSCSGMGLSRLQVNLWIPVDVHELQSILAPVPGAHPIFTYLDVCRAIPLACSHPTLLWLNHSCTVAFPLSYVTPSPPLMGSALPSSRSLLELPGTGSVRHGGSFWQLLSEAPLHPPNTKTCHAKPLLN